MKTMVSEEKMQKVSFELNGEFVELNQLLKLVGLCDSGGAGKMMVASGDVKVDGKDRALLPSGKLLMRWLRRNV